MYHSAERHSAQQQPLDAELSVHRPSSNVLVCVGNEWYRFPSSFFLPRGAQLAFVKDGFTGQLPARFTAPWPRGSRARHAHFNDGNREEPSRYVPLRSCDALIDLLPRSHANDANDAPKRRQLRQQGRQLWRAHPFLRAEASPSWSRRLYAPRAADEGNVYTDYAVLVTR